jgi:ATP-binding cassette, subfamily B, bacterial
MRETTKQTLRIYKQHAKKYPAVLTVLLLGMVVTSVVNAYVPFIYKELIDAASLGVSNYGGVIHAIKLLLIWNLVLWLAWRAVELSVDYYSPRIYADLMNTSFQYLQKHSYDFFVNNFSGSLVRKVSRFAQSFVTAFEEIYWRAGQGIMRVIPIIVVLLFKLPVLGLAVLAWSIIYIAFNYWFSKYKLGYDIKGSSADSEMNAHLADTVANNINLKLFGGYKYEFSAFKKLSEKFFRSKKLAGNIGSVSNAIQAAMIISLQVGAIYIAAGLWRQGIITVGDLVLIQIYLGDIYEKLWRLGQNIRKIFESLADAEEMTEILTAPYEVDDIANATALRVTEGQIELKGIDFSYNQKQVFKDFTLTIKPGERIALAGPSGGGKTTFVKLLFRFMDIQQGSILIDGQDISRVTQDSLRENIAMVPQEPILFHRSLMENIKYAKPEASDKDVYAAASLAHAHEFIVNFPDGYNSYVGERGVKLSGGEKQRIAIARAILKDAPILVLDEATSSLDSESELLIQDALKNLMQNKTVIVIAHRLSTIMQMDKIIVLDNGKIVEEGSHKNLLQLEQGKYRKLWGIQAGGFAE